MILRVVVAERELRETRTGMWKDRESRRDVRRR